MAHPPPLTPEQIAQLEGLAEDAARRPPGDDFARRLEYLIDTLIARGQLPASYRRLIARIHGDAPRTIVRLAAHSDKYAVPSPDIDCASRIPLCGARCCTFEVYLSAQDVAEQTVPFDIERPYRLPRDPVTRRCGCMDAAGACTIYSHRPATCREYDCRQDARVWIDFERRIPAPPPTRDAAE
jgi:Fe-S-cluster containining protein